MVTSNAFREMAKHFKNEKTGAVAGEKVIKTISNGDATSTGEGLYWKYESKLKYWDYQLNSVIGAAGELFAIRKSLYESPKPNMLVEDFYNYRENRNERLYSSL